MTALAYALTRATGTQVDVGSLTSVTLFCAVGLLASLCMMQFGLDFEAF